MLAIVIQMKERQRVAPHVYIDINERQMASIGSWTENIQRHSRLGTGLLRVRQVERPSPAQVAMCSKGE